MTLLQNAKCVIARPHGLPRRFAPRSDEMEVIARPHGLPRRFAPRSDGMEVIARPHGLPRRCAPRSDASNESFVYAIGVGHFAGGERYG
jgi:hypothetical protein